MCNQMLIFFMLFYCGYQQASRIHSPTLQFWLQVSILDKKNWIKIGKCFIEKWLLWVISNISMVPINSDRSRVHQCTFRIQLSYDKIAQRWREEFPMIENHGIEIPNVFNSIDFTHIFWIKRRSVWKSDCVNKLMDETFCPVNLCTWSEVSFV